LRVETGAAEEVDEAATTFDVDDESIVEVVEEMIEDDVVETDVVVPLVESQKRPKKTQEAGAMIKGCVKSV
jgi:hypothetical protein